MGAGILSRVKENEYKSISIARFAIIKNADSRKAVCVFLFPVLLFSVPVRTENAKRSAFQLARKSDSEDPPDEMSPLPSYL